MPVLPTLNLLNSARVHKGFQNFEGMGETSWLSSLLSALSLQSLFVVIVQLIVTFMGAINRVIVVFIVTPITTEDLAISSSSGIYCRCIPRVVIVHIILQVILVFIDGQSEEFDQTKAHTASTIMYGQSECP